MDKLQKRYGLLTAICMVVGIVIGSGVFFKAQTILQKTGGNMPLGILAWIIGGVTIGIFLDTNAGNWGNFDDVELIKKE
mgnify:CR=1 FL=1